MTGEPPVLPSCRCLAGEVLARLGIAGPAERLDHKTKAMARSHHGRGLSLLDPDMAEQAEDAAGCLTSICLGLLVPGAEHLLQGAEGGVGIEVDHLRHQRGDLHVFDLHLDLVFFRKPAKESLLELL